MRKFLMGVLAAGAAAAVGFGAQAAPAARAAGAAVPVPPDGPQVQPVQYDGDWRHHELRRREAYERWRQHEARRHWRQEHWRPHHGHPYGYGPRYGYYGGPRW